MNGNFTHSLPPLQVLIVKQRLRRPLSVTPCRDWFPPLSGRCAPTDRLVICFCSCNAAVTICGCAAVVLLLALLFCYHYGAIRVDEPLWPAAIRVASEWINW